MAGPNGSTSAGDERRRGAGLAALAVATCVGVLAGVWSPAAGEGERTMKVEGESLVLAGVEPGRLCFDGVEPGSVQVRSTYLPGQEGTVVYREGEDYTLDCERGTLARTPGSRIPDFSKNILYGQKEFDHNKFPGFGNTPFFVWVDYQTRNGVPFAKPTDQSALFPQTARKLRAGGPLKIVAYGDSITAGGDATREALRFQNRWVDDLRLRYPRSVIALENGATGGDATIQGLARLEEKVLTRQPDLVLVGFGMNDHNIAGYGVPLELFARNLTQIVKSIRERTGAEVLLYSTFPPNPDWKFGSHRMAQYAEATKQVAAELGCAYADVFAVWQRTLKRKDPSSLLGNNINHPNDFGHWLYLQALCALSLGGDGSAATGR